MKRIPIILALLASTGLAGSALAQNDNSATGDAPGIVKKEKMPAKELAPGNLQKTEKLDSAKEAAPGQVKTETQAGAETKADVKKQAESDNDMKAKGESKADAGRTRNEDQAQSGAGMKAGDGKGDRKAASDDTSKPSAETTASIDISTEQRTEIRNVIHEQSVEPADVDIDISVGVAVPTTVHLHPLPARIVTILPAYEGYEYFVLADGRIIIVEPDTLHVVYILT